MVLGFNQKRTIPTKRHRRPLVALATLLAAILAVLSASPASFADTDDSPINADTGNDPASSPNVPTFTNSMVPMADGAPTLVIPDVRFVPTSRRQVSLGVEHVHFARAAPAAQVDVAIISPEARSRLRVMTARNQVAGWRETVTSMCARISCSVAINGDYWDSQNRPSGGVVVDGELYQSPPPNHAYFTIDQAGTPSTNAFTWTVQLALEGGQIIPIDAVNRPADPGQVVLYTARRGSTTKTPDDTRELVLQILEQHSSGSYRVKIVDQRTTGNLGIPPGMLILAGRDSADAVLQELGTQAALGNDTGTITIDIGTTEYALGGSPRLIQNGFYDFPHLDPAAIGRHPRSAVGFTATGEVLLVTVDGRQPNRSLGLGYPELAELLAHLGAVEAIALDGGGSTTFVVEAQMANRPSDASPRAVVNALVVDPPTVGSARLSGANRYATSVVASQAAFPNGSPGVIIASGDNFPDALAGAAVAGATNMPVLLVSSNSIPAEVTNEIRRLGAHSAIILGGNAAISPQVETQVRSMLPFVERVSGSGRVETAVALSKMVYPNGAPVVYLATANTFPDALSAGVGAATEGGPVLLVSGDTLAPAVANELARLAPSRIVIVGGTQAISNTILNQASAIASTKRVSGANRYATSAALNQFLYGSGGVVGAMAGNSQAVVATGADFPDALSGAWLAGQRQQPLLLVEPTCTPEPALRAADTLGVNTITIMGGRAAIGAPVERLAVCAK